MEEQVSQTSVIKFVVQEEGKEIARASLILIPNDLHEEPYGLLEDVFVDEAHRGKGHGKAVTRAVIEAAKKRGCYKLICTSRHSKSHVHEMYKKLGFMEHGLEFRMNF